MDERSRTVVGRVVEFVDRTECRRLLVVVGIPVLFAVVLYERNQLGTAAVLLAPVLAAVLYTRPTTHRTIAAGAWGTGALLIGLFALALYWNWSMGSTEPLRDVVTRFRWRAVAGAALVGLGLWIRRLGR